MTTLPTSPPVNSVHEMPAPVRLVLDAYERERQIAERAKRTIARLDSRLTDDQPLRTLRAVKAAHARAGRAHTEATANARLLAYMAEAAAEKVGMVPPLGSPEPEPVRDRARPVRVGALTYALAALAVWLFRPTDTAKEATSDA